MEQYFYVAREKNGSLFLYDGKPLKSEDTWIIEFDINYMQLPHEMFPNVKWEDEEPLAVVLQQAIFKSK